MIFTARTRPVRVSFFALLLTLIGGPALAQAPMPAISETARSEMAAQYIMPPAPISEYFDRDPSYATLNAPSADGRYFVVPRWTELSTLELMSRPTYRLAELEIRPATDRLWHLDTYGIIDLRFYDLKDRRFRDAQLPDDLFISDVVWSTDGARVAFLAHLPGGTAVWTADAATGEAERLSDARILATLATSAQTEIEGSDMLQWTPEGTVITLMVPSNRGPEPTLNPVPVGPIVRKTRPEATSSRTYQNLLRVPHDAALFEHYTRAQLVELAPGEAPRPLGEPQMYESIRLSADGQYILATYIHKPFSFITSYRGFPTSTVVMNRAGEVLATVDEQELREGGGGWGGGDDSGWRDISWRPDGAGLSFVMREEGSGDERGDQVMLLPAQFDSASARVVFANPDGLRGMTYSRDGSRAFASVSKDGEQALLSWDLGAPGAAPDTVVGFYDNDEILELPGQLWTARTPNGLEYALVSSGGDAIYLRGDGYAADFRPQPFVDRVALGSGAATRIFEGSKDSWDRPLVALDADLDRMIISREGMHDFPDSFLWTGDGEPVNLTRNVDPFPEFTNARREDFSFTRSDGLVVQGRISLPLGYVDGDEVPAIFWTYPREYTTNEEYTRDAIESRNHNEYKHLAWLRWSDLWLTQGYALVYPDIPIIGENYNDTYISNMVDAVYNSMRAVDHLGYVDMDRIGHGGHSYGAFATGNLLAHTPFFKAGIAGDGAYNRSLTPTGFQAEPRNIWSAPNTYIEMSPFFKADQINTPLLMYHGAADNNTGTWPIQSERLIHALTSLGKTAVLYMYPYESHTPRALANNLDMWARWIGWFDQYVK
ncbi:MAG TPA: prolyl oligopeptidase family serine peptidase [Longimicrobiaceae bacterium]|nr:prolyl oligopeptidase family serine peptidase [Longimicrobiaceae bacterium]